MTAGEEVTASQPLPLYETVTEYEKVPVPLNAGGLYVAAFAPGIAPFVVAHW